MAKKRGQPPENLPDPTREIAPAALPDDGFVRGSAKDDVQATGSLGMRLWVYSPAKVRLLAEPTRQLAKVAQMRRLPNRKVEKVEVMLHAPTRKLYIFPPDEDVDDAFPVAYRNEGKHAEINIRSLLQSRGLEVTRGYRERYDVKLDPNSDFGPALVFQLSTNPYRERVGEGQKDEIEEEEGAAPASKKATKAKASKEKATKSAKPAADAASEVAAKAKGAETKKAKGKAQSSGTAAADADPPTAESEE